MIKILINEKAQEVFWFLWRNRKEPYTIREIARSAGVSYGSTWSVLKEFEELHIVYGIEKRKAHLYILNFENPLCFHIWSLLNALKREKIDISTVQEKIDKLQDGFAVQYPSNGTFKIMYCSKKGVEGVESVNPEDLKDILHKKRDLFTLLWNEGIVLRGEKYFYTFMWELSEKKVIGVGT